MQFSLTFNTWNNSDGGERIYAELPTVTLYICVSSFLFLSYCPQLLHLYFPPDIA